MNRRLLSIQLPMIPTLREHGRSFSLLQSPFYSAFCLKGGVFGFGADAKLFYMERQMVSIGADLSVYETRDILGWRRERGAISRFGDTGIWD
jgi:hypothetical protein